MILFSENRCLAFSLEIQLSMWVQGIFRSVNTIRYEKYIYFKVSCLCLVLLSELAMAQEWVTWSQQKYQTGYFTVQKFNS